jgi:hypothetical protein
MAGTLDAGWLRVVGYFVAALACVIAGVIEQRRTPRGPELWPAFWFSTAVVLTLMGFARAGDVGGFIAGVGREQAEEHGWYDVRRSYQAAAVGTVASIWAIFVVAAVWRVPERRRRYLPAALVVVTIICFAAARMISLHQVDSLLYRRDVSGVRFVAVIELGLLGLMLLTIAVPLARRRRVEAPPVPGRASFAE